MKPADNHPWGWKARHGAVQTDVTQVKISRKPLQLLLTDLIVNWNTFQIPVRYRGKFDSYLLIELPDNIVAKYFTSLLNHYTGYSDDKEEQIDIDEVE